MQTFFVTVSWTMTALMEIEAENKNAAIKNAYLADLPTGDYCNDSFEVDEDTIEIKKQPKK